MITRKWVIENGIGHWEVTNGQDPISCDDNELTETINELERRQYDREIYSNCA